MAGGIVADATLGGRTAGDIRTSSPFSPGWVDGLGEGAEAEMLLALSVTASTSGVWPATPFTSWPGAGELALWPAWVAGDSTEPPRLLPT